jgi:(2Fe-2S) ferredoxin
MQIHEAPYQCHLFICVKTRGGLRKSCGDQSNTDLKAALKDEIKKRGWQSRVRISESSCLGLCDEGPNVIIYPQKIWYSAVSSDDLPAILTDLEKLLEE